MVLAAPGPLLTPPPSSSPPKTPHRSYSAQTRSQDEEKNPPPKPYLPLQTRTRHRRSHRPHVPKLMRGTPSTMRSPPHQSRPTDVTTRPPPQKRDAVHRELRHGTGKGANAGAGPLRRATRPTAGPAPAAARPAAATPHDTSPANNNSPEEMRTSCRQQPAPPPRDAANMK